MPTPRPFSWFAGLALVAAACGPAPVDPATPDKGATPPTPSSTAVAAATCSEGKGECDGNTATACETDLQGNAAHCGACGTVCGAGESCLSGGCKRSQQLVSLSGMACAVVSGQVACWGDNSYEVIGGEPKGPRATPGMIPGIDKALSVSLGRRFGCAVTTGGKVQCFQEGKSRELPLVSDVVDAAIQNDVVYLVRKNSELSAVALGYDGKDLRPTEVVPVKGLVAVAAGSNHACALHKNGEVTCWGDPQYTGLGIDTKEMEYEKRREVAKEPGKVVGLKDAVQLSVSDSHSCAVRKSNKIVCWGSNWSGELGDGSQDQRAAPVAVQLLDDAVEVATGYHHTCARRVSGKVVCWGESDSGQLGAGASAGRGMVEVKDLEDATSLTAGDNFTCARRASGGISCWGAASRGRLGNGTVSDYVSPQPVNGITGATMLAIGDKMSCALDGAKKLHCWGLPGWSSDNVGKRGFTPKAIEGLGEVDGAVMSSSSICVSTKAKTTYCDSAGQFLKEPKPLALKDVKAVRSWGSFGTGIAGAGQVVLWARQNWNKPEEVQKTNIAGLADAVAVAGDSSVVCAVRRSGKVGCATYSYRTFDKKDPIKPAPVVEIPGITDAIAIASESGEVCVLRKSGSVDCFSTYRIPPPVDPKKPPTPNKEKPSPIEVKTAKGVTDATQVAMGGGARCALLKGGTLMCWGSNTTGQLGLGDYEYRWDPTAVPNLTDVAVVGVGGGQTCAAKKSGEVLCWGRNESDEAGQAADAFARGPVSVQLPKGN